MLSVGWLKVNMMERGAGNLGQSPACGSWSLFLALPMAGGLHGSWDQICFCPGLFSLLSTHKAKLWFNSLLIKEGKRLLNGITFTEPLNRKPNEVGSDSAHLQSQHSGGGGGGRSEFVANPVQASQGYMIRPCLKKSIKKKKEKEKWCFKYRRWVLRENWDGQCRLKIVGETPWTLKSYTVYSSICSPNILIG